MVSVQEMFWTDNTATKSYTKYIRSNSSSSILHTLQLHSIHVKLSGQYNHMFVYNWQLRHETTGRKAAGSQSNG